MQSEAVKKAVERAAMLMKLAHDRLSSEVETEFTQRYDDADCDGLCLATDLELAADELLEAAQSPAVEVDVKNKLHGLVGAINLWGNLEYESGCKFAQQILIDYSECIRASLRALKAAQQPADNVGDLLGNYTGGYSGPSGPTSAPPTAAQISGMVEVGVEELGDVLYESVTGFMRSDADDIHSALTAAGLRIVKDKA